MQITINICKSNKLIQKFKHDKHNFNGGPKKAQPILIEFVMRVIIVIIIIIMIKIWQLMNAFYKNQVAKSSMLFFTTHTFFSHVFHFWFFSFSICRYKSIIGHRTPFIHLGKQYGRKARDF